MRVTAYRAIVQRAYQSIGQGGKTFDLWDVSNAIPLCPTKPSERQIRRLLCSARDLEVAKAGDSNNLTKYRLAVNLRAMSDEQTLEIIDERTERTILDLAAHIPFTCWIQMGYRNGEVVVDQSLDLTIRGDEKNARAAFAYLFESVKLDENRTDLKINREAIAAMREVEDDDGYHAVYEGDGHRIEFFASNDPVDLGHLMNAVRVNGGLAYFDRGLASRNKRRK
jgi:hypothetical protein